MTTLSFAKLHGTANDFIYVDAREGFPGDPAALAPRLCDRRRGVGADGLILVLPPLLIIGAALAAWHARRRRTRRRLLEAS